MSHLGRGGLSGQQHITTHSPLPTPVVLGCHKCESSGFLAFLRTPMGVYAHVCVCAKLKQLHETTLPFTQCKELPHFSILLKKMHHDPLDWCLPLLGCPALGKTLLLAHCLALVSQWLGPGLGMGERQAGHYNRLDAGAHVTGCFGMLWVQGQSVAQGWGEDSSSRRNYLLQTGKCGGSSWSRALAPSWVSVGGASPGGSMGSGQWKAGARAGEEGRADTSGCRLPT